MKTASYNPNKPKKKPDQTNQHTKSDNKDRDDNSKTRSKTRRRSKGIDTGLVIMDDAQIIVPLEVRRICKAVQDKIGHDNEMSILFKGEWTDDGYKVQPDYIVPEQTVTRTHVDYDEDLKPYRDEGYTVHVHSHPFSKSSTTFSGTDESYTNSNFKAALLMNGDYEFTDSRLSLTVETGKKLRLQPDIKTLDGLDTTPDVDIDDKITEKTQLKTTRKTKSSKSRGSRKGRRSSRSRKRRGHQKNLRGERVSPEDEKQNPFDPADYQKYKYEEHIPSEEELEEVMNSYRP